MRLDEPTATLLRRLSADNTTVHESSHDNVLIGSTVLGVFFVVLGTFFSAVGAHLMKWSHETETHLVWYCRWRLITGLFCALILLFLCDGVSYAVLPLAMIAPFGGFPIIISAVLSATGTCCVREPLERFDVGAMLAVFAGVTTVSIVTANTGFEEQNLQTLQDESLAHPVFITLLAIAFVVDAAWLAFHFAPSLRATTIDAWEGKGAVWPAVVSATLAAFNTGFQQVFMKTVSEAVHEVGDGVAPSEVLSSATPWLGLTGLLTLGPLSAILINLSLGTGRSINLAVPAYQSLTLLITIAVGAYFLNELAVTGDHAALFVVGVLFVLSGLLGLSYRQQERLMLKRLADSGAGGGKSEATPLKS